MGVERPTPLYGQPSGRVRWQKYPCLRRYILFRDRACLECGATERLEVDHVIAVADGGANHPDNLQTLCASCHGKKTGGWWRQRALTKAAG